MPRAKTPAQALQAHQARERKQKLEAKYAVTGKRPEKPPEGAAERDYQAMLEAKGQLTIFSAIAMHGHHDYQGAEHGMELHRGEVRQEEAHGQSEQAPRADEGSEKRLQQVACR